MVFTARVDAPRLQAILFDRDNTLVVDTPYNGDPELVRPMPHAAAAIDAARRAGVRLGVVSNQSGIRRGLITAAQVAAVNARIDAELGPFDTWQICPHVPADSCLCRKPLPGLIQQAAVALGVPVASCAVVGDQLSDVAAASAAGARGVLVSAPPGGTAPAGALLAGDLLEAVGLLLALR